MPFRRPARGAREGPASKGGNWGARPARIVLGGHRGPRLRHGNLRQRNLRQRNLRQRNLPQRNLLQRNLPQRNRGPCKLHRSHAPNPILVP